MKPSLPTLLSVLALLAALAPRAEPAVSTSQTSTTTAVWVTGGPAASPTSATLFIELPDFGPWVIEDVKIYETDDGIVILIIVRHAVTGERRIIAIRRPLPISRPLTTH